MYINFKELRESDFTIEDIETLVGIRQKEDESILRKDSVDILLERGYIEKFKNGNLKLSSKGQSFLNVIETPGLTEEVSSLVSSLVKMYELNDKPTGIIKEVEQRVSWFLHETGFGVDKIKQEVGRYLTDNDKFTMSLSNLIWKPKSVAFSVHMKLSESMLFDLMARRYGLNTSIYFADKKSKDIAYIMAVSKLPNPPASISPDSTITGSVKGDKEAILKARKMMVEYINERKEE